MGGSFSIGIDEVEKFVGVSFAHEIHQPSHGIVVEGYIALIGRFGMRRVELRPTTVCILSLEDVVDAFEHGGAILFVVSDLIDMGQISEFVGGGAVIEGGIELVAVAGVKFGGCVDVLGPASGIGLIRQNVVGDLLRFVAGEPIGRRDLSKRRGREGRVVRGLGLRLRIWRIPR